MENTLIHILRRTAMIKNSEKNNVMLCPKIEPFELVVSKGEINIVPSKGDALAHIHSHFEIFINVTGNISFMALNKVYALSHGDIIIVKPNEYHHAIYRHSCRNVFFVVSFPAIKNEMLFEPFLNLSDSSERLINLSADGRDKVIGLCEVLAEQNGTSTQYLTFFNLIDILSSAIMNANRSNRNEPQFDTINEILKFANENYNTINSISDLATQFHMSLKTLERLFKKHLNSTPKNYLDMLMLSKASEFLRQDMSVTEVCYKCGFKDCSRFIKYFKNQFGETPLQYKKRFLNSLSNAYYLQNNMKKPN